MTEQTTHPNQPTTPKPGQPAGAPTTPPKGADAKGADAAKGNGRKRGRPAGTEAKVWDYTGLDASFLGAPQEVTDTLASMAAPVRARDDRQIAMDRIVSDLYGEWDAKGQPAKWAQMPKRSYAVAPNVADTVRMLVRRAASWHGYSAKFGQPVRDAEGRELVVFAIRAARTRVKVSDDQTFTLEDLRTFVTEFYGEDEAEAAEEFMAALAGENDSDEGTEGDA